MTYRLTCLALLATLTLYALPGLYMRPELDDYCYRWVALDSGAWGTMTTFYNQWQGRYTWELAAGIAWQGAWVGYIPSLLIMFTVASLYTLVRLFAPRPLLMALACTYGVIAFQPNLFQSLYWSSASLAYFPGIGCLCLLGALLLSRWHFLQRGFTN